ncbi:hypothetical protein L208DRAFT_1415890 [Tricholoma matsutake]|nr:hypothetical protein L208DRAFT_1415890 [Tricholoma matsutake 945]
MSLEHLTTQSIPPAVSIFSPHSPTSLHSSSTGSAIYIIQSASSIARLASISSRQTSSASSENSTDFNGLRALSNMDLDRSLTGLEREDRSRKRLSECPGSVGWS